MKNSEREVSIPMSPIKKNKNDVFLNPSSLFQLFCIMVAVIRGTTHSARLDIISMIPIADPNTFRCTTMGMAATITLAQNEYPIPIRSNPQVAAYSDYWTHCGQAQIKVWATKKMHVAPIMKKRRYPTRFTRMPKGPLNNAVAMQVMVITYPAEVWVKQNLF